MSSAIKHYVHIQGVFDDYVSIKAVDVGGTIEDFIEDILNQKQSKLSAHFNVDIDAGEVKLYYQGSDIKSKTTVETLAGHWQKLSELIKPGQENAFFRMEILTVSPLIGKLFHTFYFMCFFVNDFSFLSFLQRQQKLAS